MVLQSFGYCFSTNYQKVFPLIPIPKNDKYINNRYGTKSLLNCFGVEPQRGVEYNSYR
jgi:hypothetical protein